jgi:3-oxoacyl-[acyl-carrier-protein] synthase-3
MMHSRIISTGHHIPGPEIRNSDLKQFPPNAIPLIEQKTGIRARHYAAPEQCTSDLAYLAARECLGRAGLEPGKVQGIILATSSPDRIQPATAARVQALLNADQAFAVDVNSVCSGGIFALHFADNLIKSGQYDNILVIASEVYSKILNPGDFATFPYFGDGAGAVLLGAEPSAPGIIGSIIKTDGRGHDVIQVPGGGTMMPGPKVGNPRDWYFTMKGREVYDFAVARGSEIIDEILARYQVERSQLKAVVPHQANISIIDAIAANSGIPRSKFYVNLYNYGNTAGASVMIALSEAVSGGSAGPGDQVLLVAFGGGLSWGAALIKL